MYRDSGLPGDDVVSHLVRTAPTHLADGGWLQVVANWAIHRDVPWDERIAGWVPDGCSAFVVQREVVDPAAYVELWLRDEGLQGGPEYLDRYDAWLGWLDEQGIEGIGFGWVNLHEGRAPELVPRLAVRRRATRRVPPSATGRSPRPHPVGEHERLDPACRRRAGDHR